MAVLCNILARGTHARDCGVAMAAGGGSSQAIALPVPGPGPCSALFRARWAVQDRVRAVLLEERQQDHEIPIKRDKEFGQGCGPGAGLTTHSPRCAIGIRR